VVSEPSHWISDLVALGVAAFGALTPVDGHPGAQRSLSMAERSVIVLSAKSVQEGAERVPDSKAQQKLAQSANSSGEDDELFARAAGRIPKWKNPAEGLLPSGDATIAAPAVDGAARAAAEGAAGTPRSRKPGALDKRKDPSRAPGGAIGRQIVADQDKALGALPPSRRKVLGSQPLVGARANETAAVGEPAETARSDERTAIQSAIRGQLDAFASGDGASAYSFAAPSVKTQYRSPATFLSMVREGYAAIYRHKRAQFGELGERGERRVQTVRLTDHDDRIWTALYALEKQPDGSWLISGCTLTRGDQAYGTISATP
jgi:hypothetical protein